MSTGSAKEGVVTFDNEHVTDTISCVNDVLNLRQKVHAVFDAHGAEEEWYAQQERRNVTTAIFIISFSMIILSCTTFTVESMPEYYNRDLIEFYIIEAVCIGWFTFELVTRLLTCESKKDFLRDILNWVDLVSIAPFYVDLFVSSVTNSSAKADGLIVLRTVRLTRVFRVFKLSKYSEGIQMVTVSVARSTDALSLLVFLMAIAMVLFGSGIYFAEQTAATWDAANRTWVRKEEYGGPDTEHKIKSIPYGFWWCLVTVTTVGYGDMYPVTLWGHLVGTVTMLTGLLIVAFPIIILGANFQDVHQEFKDAKAKRKMVLEMTERRKSGVLCETDAAALEAFQEGGRLSDSIDEQRSRSGFMSGKIYVARRDVSGAQAESIIEVLNSIRATQQDIQTRLTAIESHLSPPCAPDTVQRSPHL